MSTKPLFPVLLIALLAVPLASFAEEPVAEKPCVDDQALDESELSADVPELHAFHEVIFPLWHEAWPEKNTEMMRELLPQVQEHVKAVQAVELPGILRDKKEAWSLGVTALTATLTSYENAAANGDNDALLDAVETLHANFENLVRTVRPVMQELGDYHVELYKIYHHLMPDRNLDGLRATATVLDERCQALAAAKIPKWYEGKQKRLEAGIQDLCQRTAMLNEVLRTGDWEQIVEAVETMHTQYQKLEHMFD